MKTLVLTEKNAPLVVQERADLSASEGMALVKVHAAALNHRDVFIQKGMYAGLKYPIVPGSDGAGVVVEVGDGAGGIPDGGEAGFGGKVGGVGKDWIGKEVIINPAFNWGNNPLFQHPKDFSILGLPEDGSFSEFVKVPVSSLVAKPAHLSFEEAAALPLAGATAYRAVFTRAQLKMDERGGAGEKVLITGIGGGVAVFALQYAVAVGAQVYVTSGSPEKIGRAKQLGAIDGVNYKDENWGRDLQEMAGSFDVIIDGAAGDGMDELLNLATPGGRLAFYGATRGNPSHLTARRIFWKQLTILGSTMASPEDFKSMVAFVNEHKLRPVVDKVFPFEEGEAAFRRMDEAQQFGEDRAEDTLRMLWNRENSM